MSMIYELGMSLTRFILYTVNDILIVIETRIHTHGDNIKDIYRYRNRLMRPRKVSLTEYGLNCETVVEGIKLLKSVTRLSFVNCCAIRPVEIRSGMRVDKAAAAFGVVT
jgi:hypothetical protein